MRNILLSVMGKTPQVLTETLYYLHRVRRPPVHIDENHVITTLEGQRLCEADLTRESDGRLHQLCRDYHLSPECIVPGSGNITLLLDEQGNPLPDLRTVNHNTMAGNQIIDTVHRLTRDPDTAVFASVAGGRKTMSVYLGFGLQLFGREQDSLLHVLIPEEYEGDPNFFYPRPGREDQVPVDCSEIPFIRLGEVMPRMQEGDFAYSQIISNMQQSLEAGLTYPVVRFTNQEKYVHFGKTPIELSPLQMAVWATLAEQKIDHCVRPDLMVCGECTECFLPVSESNGHWDEFVEKIINKYDRYHPREVLPENPTVKRLRESYYKEGGIRVFWETRSTLNKKLKGVAGERLAERALVIRSVGKKDKRYGVAADKTKLERGRR